LDPAQHLLSHHVPDAVKEVVSAIHNLQVKRPGRRPGAAGACGCRYDRSNSGQVKLRARVRERGCLCLCQRRNKQCFQTVRQTAVDICSACISAVTHAANTKPLTQLHQQLQVVTKQVQQQVAWL
jgi:hypothetical protein